MLGKESAVQRRGRPTTVGKGKPSRTGRGLALPLTGKQLRFIQCWMVRRNSTRAYMDAYPNVSYATANANGSRLFRDARICSLIRAALSEERERLESNGRKVTDHLAALAFSSISDVFAKDGTIVAPADMPHSVS